MLALAIGCTFVVLAKAIGTPCLHLDDTNLYLQKKLELLNYGLWGHLKHNNLYGSPFFLLPLTSCMIRGLILLSLNISFCKVKIIISTPYVCFGGLSELMYANSLSRYLNKLADHSSCFAKEDGSYCPCRCIGLKQPRHTYLIAMSSLAVAPGMVSRHLTQGTHRLTWSKRSKAKKGGLDQANTCFGKFSFGNCQEM